MKVTTNVLNGFLVACLCGVMACGGPDKKGGEEADKERDTEAKEAMEEEKRIKSLKEEAMKVHDEVMPKMDSLIRLRKQLEQMLEETKSGAQSEEIEQVINQLEQAEEGMRGWMRRMSNYRSRKDTMGLDAKEEFLDKEKEAMKDVKQEMLESLKDAKEILKSREKQNQKAN